MNVSKLTLLQKDLDAAINKNHPIKDGEDRVANKITALIVELAEFANEGRWFKYWSEDSQPRVLKERIIGHVKDVPVTKKSNPLLEEYVDSIHFFISIAIEKEWEKLLYVSDEWLVEIEEEGFHGGLTGAFNEVIYSLMKSHRGWSTKEEDFNRAWRVFIAIGVVGFGFTDEAIEAAYISKNKENHSRQKNGY